MSLFIKCFLKPVPLGLSALSVLAALALGSPLWVLAGLAVGAAVAAVASMDRQRRALYRLARAPGIDQTIVAGIEALSTRLDGLKRSPGLGQGAYRAAEQLLGAHERYLAFASVLGQRFEPRELTYGRYLEAGRQVYLGTVDELTTAATALEAVSGVDAQGLRSELRRLERRADEDATEARRRDALAEQLATHDSELERAEERIASAGEGVAGLTGAATALARVETQRGLAIADGVDSMAELRALVDRAERYALPHKGS